MTSNAFLFLSLAAIVGLYLRLPRQPDEAGWWIGLLHGVLMITAVAGLSAAKDTGFTVAMTITIVYAGAMAATEVVHRVRHLGGPA